MNIALETVDQDKLTELFKAKSNLRNLAFDFCTTFNVKISQIKNSGALKLATPNGLDAGELYTASNTRDRSETVYIYENSYLIKKEKGSSNSTRSERESNKIATLIRTLKKNNEAPTDVAMTKAYSEEMITAIHPVKDAARYGAPKLDLNKDIVKMLTEFYLGVDTVSIKQYSTELKDSYSKHLVDMQKYNESTDDHQRFCNGFKIIGINYGDFYNNSEPPKYLVGEAEVITSDTREKVLVQGGLKSYSSLKEVPEVAVDAMMIATYMQGKSSERIYSDRNELFMNRMDRYIPELDIGVGFRNSVVWVAIPRTPKI